MEFLMVIVTGVLWIFMMKFLLMVLLYHRKSTVVN
jgi:hypothetical protein